MSWLRVVMVVALVACTKSNPAKDCADGVCSDPHFPFCDVTGSIGGEAQTCISVTCSAGEVGACDGAGGLVCNATGNGYETTACSIACDVSTGTCIDRCTMHSQCASGICKPDGACAAASEIVFTSPTGGFASDCSQVAPCSLERALELVPPTSGQYIQLVAGNYVNPATLTASGKRFLVGAGAGITSVKNGAMGPVFILPGGADVTFDSLRIVDAIPDQSGEVRGAGWGVYADMSAFPTSLHILDAVLANNGSGSGGGAVTTYGGTLEFRRSTFSGNNSGAIVSGQLTADRCSFISNSNYGLFMTGNFAITNSFFVRNNQGTFIQGATTSPMFAFNTVADNVTGVTCGYANQYVAIDAIDNIIVRNGTNTSASATPCAFSGSIVSSGLAQLNFVRPDVAPYDYHLTAGSTAIDAATTSTDHDFDGLLRTTGSADVGADELD